MLIDFDSDMYFVFRGSDLHNAHTNILQKQFRDGGGGKGSEAMHIFFCKEVPNLVKPAYVILECSQILICQDHTVFWCVACYVINCYATDKCLLQQKFV